MTRPRPAHRLPRSAGVSTLRQQATVPAFIDSSLSKPRAGLVGTAAVRQMASDFRDAHAREGGISRDELITLGWTEAQINIVADAARTQAQAQAGVA